jgi:glycosyltransferase involved in cell wall biosynthesis
MTGPLVSVIVPTFNQHAFVAQTVQSVLDQTWRQFELIVTDDGSTDGTSEVLRGWAAEEPDRIRLLTSDRNRGIAANFNRGLAAARGELIAWLGGDDVMAPEKLERQVGALAARPDAVACVHDGDVFASDSGQSLGLFSALYSGGRLPCDGGVELAFDPTYAMLPSSLMVRAAACPAHGFDERLRFLNDWLFLIEVLRRGHCVGLADVLVRYRRHSANVTASEENVRAWLEEALIVLGIVGARYPDLDQAARAYRVAALLTEAKWRHDRGDRRARWAYAQSALREAGPLPFLRTSARMAAAYGRRRRAARMAA